MSMVDWWANERYNVYATGSRELIEDFENRVNEMDRRYWEGKKKVIKEFEEQVKPIKINKTKLEEIEKTRTPKCSFCNNPMKVVQLVPHNEKIFSNGKHKWKNTYTAIYECPQCYEKSKIRKYKRVSRQMFYFFKRKYWPSASDY